jgi:hypothetical protein
MKSPVYLAVSPLPLRFALTRYLHEFDKVGMMTERKIKYESLIHQSYS